MCVCVADGQDGRGRRHCGGIATRRGKGEEAIVLYIPIAEEKGVNDGYGVTLKRYLVLHTSCTHFKHSPMGV